MLCIRRRTCILKDETQKSYWDICYAVSFSTVVVVVVCERERVVNLLVSVVATEMQGTNCTCIVQGSAGENVSWPTWSFLEPEDPWACSQNPTAAPNRDSVDHARNLIFYIFKINFNIVLQSTLNSSEMYRLQRFSELECSIHLPSSCLLWVRSSHPSWFHHANNIWQKA
jgi:hypothetical protein